MTVGDGRMPDFDRLHRIQLLAIMLGALTLGASLYLLGQFSEPELGPIVISVAFTGIVSSAAFYFGCLLFEGSLQKYIRSDDSVIKGDRVELVTATQASGDVEIDDWVARFVFARNLFGLSVIPLALLAGLWLFG